MTKIPEDVWSAAREIAAQVLEADGCKITAADIRAEATAAGELWEVKAAARAILAERERCALVIERNMLCEDESGEVLLPRSNPGNCIGMAYAAAIRRGGEA